MKNIKQNSKRIKKIIIKITIGEFDEEIRKMYYFVFYIIF